jgi:hypothetical protein
MMRLLLPAAVALSCTACDGRVLYSVEGTVTSSVTQEPIQGIRVSCALASDPQSAGEAFTVSDGFYSCTAVDLDAPSPGLRADVVVRFTDEDEEQNGAFADLVRTISVPQGQSVSLDVELDPA